MKIYTKLGDKGETSLIGGKRIPKHHIKIEAYGTVDELIAYIAVIRDSNISDNDKDFLLGIQHILMHCTAILAADSSKTEFNLPEITTKNINDLEIEIDHLERKLPVLKKFVIPGGHIAASHCHVARNICRRAERIIVKLNNEEKTDENLLKYINRLSDYLFVLSRKILIDNDIDEIEWNF